MSAKGTWIIKSKHINPNDFYVKVDGSEFYTAYWVVKAANDEQARSLALEACEELDLGVVDIEDVIGYAGQKISGAQDVDSAIETAVVKFAESNEAQLAAWISSQGGKW